MFKHSGWMVVGLADGAIFEDRILVGPTSKRRAKRVAKAMSTLTTVCLFAEAISLRSYLGGSHVSK